MKEFDTRLASRCLLSKSCITSSFDGKETLLSSLFVRFVPSPHLSLLVPAFTAFSLETLTPTDLEEGVSVTGN